jgi:hypothetical protein
VCDNTRNSNIRGIKTATQDLTNNDGCANAIGFGTWQAAVGRLNSMQIDDVALKFQPTSDGGLDFLAAFAPGNGTIQLNNNAALSNLSAVPLGNGTSVNVLSAVEQQFGLKTDSLSSSLFWAINELHELGHVTGAFGDDTGNTQQSNTYTQKVIDNCFGFLKK